MRSWDAPVVIRGSAAGGDEAGRAATVTLHADGRLVESRYLRYRLAIATLPSLAAARHEEAEWPGRAGVEAMFESTQSPDDVSPDR